MPQPTTTPPGLRERKKTRTRRSIAETALDLFEERGYGATTVEHIAAAADISPRTFFRYFATKDEVVFDEADKITTHLRDLLAARPADEPLLTSLREMSSALVRDGQVDQDRLRRVLRLTHAEPALRAGYAGLLTDVEADLTKWAAGRLAVEPSDLLPRLIAATALAARRVAMARWLEDDDRADLAHHITQAIDMLGAGLGTVVPATTTPTTMPD